ncbi:hypothetical protein [Natronobacterium gregoryi]|uniref:Uncharacterized protein n=2 Tax=Natronobacterium gregoryi TaxID=44930 RepID=L0ALS3_NATGS|nr:hypothetical protein [Natronobacterium gregoryi]AFZ74409.1 hypothetical protein Natgr_3283 [Natronobacterium gregoryi SP2]ELY72131.1 hypothetical protein C490_04227 [Natronobacterium gregoryi SP2]PLK19739.1 hypothetical protein CYV19_13100 [Natronobacterium gregoryi SP2]SFJ40405.1 hypothetical protein SAMN05443661_12710 [Natronobacterium gregoryi]
MHVRSPSRETESTDQADSSSGSRIGRKLFVLAVGVVAVAYLVSRYRSERLPSSVAELRERAPATQRLREEATDAVSNEFQPIPIGDSEETETDEAETDDTTDVVDDVETTSDVTDEERSPAEIAERAAEDGPEPGEMAVDEAVEDELAGEESAEDEE